MLRFTKMNGAGNDFVLLDNRAGSLQLGAPQIARLCDRHRGVGADGVLLVEPAQNGAGYRMRYYNADGGEAEMCGNGARCFARFANRLTGEREAIRFETPAGVITARPCGENIRLEMSEPKDLRLSEKVTVGKGTVIVHSVNTGVPHAVLLAEELENADVVGIGAAIRYHQHFAPKGTNVNFVKTLDPSSIAIRTYERGVEGETLACGTGVVASAIIFHELTSAQTPISVLVRGGEKLEVDFQKNGGVYQKVTLTGPADFVFDGEIEL